MEKVLYLGIFVLGKYCSQLTSTCYPMLSNRVRNPHVTLAYKPDKVDEDILGQEIDFVLTGYANDGNNAGFSVELIDPPQIILNTIEPGRILHITTSVSETGAPKNTQFLDFKPIDRILLRGTVGVMQSDNTIRGFKKMGAQIIKSKFLFPFWVQKKTNISNNWKQTEIKTEYLSKYIAEIFNSNNEIIESLHYEKPLIADSENQELNLIYKEGISPSRFTICNIQIYAFATNMCFLTVEVEHNASSTYDEVCNTSAKMAYLFSEDKYVKWKFVSANGQEIKLHEAVKDIVSTVYNEAIEWFPASENHKAYVYHQMLCNTPSDEDKKALYKLIRVWNASSSVDLDENELSNPIWKIDDRRFWGINSSGVMSLSYNDGDNHFIKNAYQAHVNRDYFMVFLLALHEREVLLRYNYEVVRQWKRPSKLVKLKNQLLKFNTWFSYNSVSSEYNYQRFYEEIYRAFNLELLETDVEEVISKVDEAVKENKDKKQNALLSSIAILAVVSALTDAFSFIDRITSGDPVGIIHYIVLGVIAIIVVVGILIFRK